MSADTDQIQELAVPAVLSPDAVDAFTAALDGLAASSPHELVLACQGLDYITSSHIGLMWQARRACEAAGIRIRLGSPPAGLLHVLGILGLCQFFPLGTDTDDAAALNEGGPESIGDADVYRDVFRAGAGSTDDAIERFVHFLGTLALPESLRFELRTIFYEVAYNIHLHSGLPPEAEVSVSAEVRPSGIRITFFDAGVPFDPTRAHTVSTFADVARGRQRRGLGLPMLGKLTDNMIYTRTDDGANVLTLEKTWGGLP